MLACKAEEFHTILRGGVRFCGLDSKKVSPECKWNSLWTEPAFEILLLLLLLLYCCCCYVDVTSCFARLSANHTYSCLPCVFLTTPSNSSFCSCFSSFIIAIRLWYLRRYWCCLPYWIGLVSLSVTCCHIVSGVFSWCQVVSVLNSGAFLLFYLTLLPQ